MDWAKLAGHRLREAFFQDRHLKPLVERSNCLPQIQIIKIERFSFTPLIMFAELVFLATNRVQFECSLGAVNSKGMVIKNL